MRSEIFNLDWSKFDLKDPEQTRQLQGALQFYLATPDKFLPHKLAKSQAFVKAHQAAREAQAQHFGVLTNFPAETSPVKIWEKFHLMPAYDSGYEQIFDVKDFGASGANGFDILDVGAGLTFREILVGEKIDVHQMGGKKERCYFSYYGGGLGWHRQLFEDGEYWTLEDNAKEFRGKAYGTRAGVFYGLLEAVGDQYGCCAPLVGTSLEDSIARSINHAAYEIIERCKNKGYGLDPKTTSFVVLTPHRLMGEVRRALALRFQAFAEAERVANYNVQQITSIMLTNQNRIIVALPKNKLKAGYRMDLTIFNQFDILSYTETAAGWMRYGGCVGDIDQVQCIDLEPLSGSCPPGETEVFPVGQDLK